jgi:predicted phage terminase large subunit-like protein
LLAGGSYYAVGSGGALTGRGADILLIDDPVKGREDADSATYWRNLHDWYQSVAFTRLQPGGAVVLIQTRWHEDDLGGWLLREHAAENWTVVSLPAIAEPGDALGRAEGQALWPAKFSIKTLNRSREAIGSAAFASLYQQRPAAIEGSIFKREWWRFYAPAGQPPRFEEVILSLDTAYKTGASSDYSVALVLGVGDTGYFILDVWRGRAEFPKLKAIVTEMAAKWRPDRVLIEDAASGQSLIQELRTSSRLAVTPVKVGSDKISRAHAVTPMIDAGRVFLPEQAPWLGEFLDELSSFPAAAHDDQTDSLTQVLNYIREDASYSNLRGYYQNQTAIEHYHATANYGIAAMKSGLTVPEVEALVNNADDDEYSRAYNEEMNRLQGGPQVEYSYGDRPSLTDSIHRALDDIVRGK